MRFVVFVMDVELFRLFDEFAVERVLLAVLDGDDDGLLHLVADDESDTLLSMISLFHPGYFSVLFFSARIVSIRAMSLRVFLIFIGFSRGEIACSSCIFWSSMRAAAIFSSISDTESALISDAFITKRLRIQHNRDG